MKRRNAYPYQLLERFLGLRSNRLTWSSVIRMTVVSLVILIIVYLGMMSTENRRVTSPKELLVDCRTAGERNFPNVSHARTPIDSVTRTGVSLEPGPGFTTPNIIHYIWYTDSPKEFLFVNMISMLSAHHFDRPEAIMFWTNLPPVGKYWDRVKTLPELKVIPWHPTLCFFDRPIKNPYYDTSASDVDRLRVLAEAGGTFLDLDTVVTRSLDDLRRHTCSVGFERDSPPKVCGAAIVCSRESEFLRRWMMSYIFDYRIETWAYNSGRVPTELALKYPGIVNVEKEQMQRPNFAELHQIWGGAKLDWREKYTIHTWYHSWKSYKSFLNNWIHGSISLLDIWTWGTEPDMDNIKIWKGTFGELSRTALFGSPKIIIENTKST